MSDEYFMQQALREAEKAYQAGEVPVGAVVAASDGRIIARCHNQTELLNDVTAHAEMLAITSAATVIGGKYLTDCTLYVTLEPCLMCAGALAWSQVSRVVYGASDPKRGFSTQPDSSKIFHPKTVVESGLLAEECGEIVRSFFAEKRKS